jgi:cellulose synthase/poly-beta-1,6-N-acetylglucosamine synthase-like glycosyltransferase
VNERDLTATVVVATRDRGDMIAATLRSLLAVGGPAFSVLVVDQSADDRTRRTVEAVACGDPRVSVHATTSAGLSNARNIGLELAAGDVVAFTDDDCTVDPYWLPAIVREFRDPRVAAVFGRVVPPGFTRRRGTEVAFKASEARVEYTRPLPPWYIGHGASMAVRRRAVLAIGGFDALLGAGGPFPAGEDLDVAYRLLRSGSHVVYTGAARAHHQDWRDWPSRRRTERGYGVGAGALFTKYLRCGDRYALRLLATWVWQLGVRRLGAGLLKWRSRQVAELGCCQLVYPWVGVARSLRLPVDRELVLYRRAPEEGGGLPPP